MRVTSLSQRKAPESEYSIPSVSLPKTDADAQTPVSVYCAETTLEANVTKAINMYLIIVKDS